MTAYNQVFGKQTEYANSRIVVGLTAQHGDIERFAVQLQDQVQLGEWATIAQIQHNPGSSDGHDVFEKGLRVEVDRPRNSTLNLWPRHDPLPRYPGGVVRLAVDYLDTYTPTFRRIADGEIQPSRPREL